MQKIYKKQDKALIPTLPRTLFGGKIVLVTGMAEAEKAVAFLMTQPRIGIDTETRPSFKRGQNHTVALLQVATDDVCFLFRLNRIGLPDCIVRMLESPQVMKVGLSLNDDFCMLRHRYAGLKPQNYVELQRMVSLIGVEDLSLQKLYANLLNGFISKRQQLTNWEADSLTPAQQQYAATDAWACLRLYDKMTELVESNDYELVDAPASSVTENQQIQYREQDISEEGQAGES